MTTVASPVHCDKSQLLRLVPLTTARYGDRGLGYAAGS
jgi:hypothetical protein